jgi:hypothetical protein
LEKNIKLIALQIFLLFLSAEGFGQNIAINANGDLPNNSAMLDISSNSSGLLIPRMTEAQKNGIAGPATGLLVYQTNGTTGFYYFDGTNWLLLASGEAWNLTGNAGTNVNDNFVGTTDNNALRIRTNNAFRFEFTTNGRLRSENNGDAAQPSYSWVGTGGTTVGMFRPAANQLAFSSSSAERMRINATGNVGINTNNPTQRLHLVGNFRLQGALMPNNNAGTANQILLSNGANNSPAWSPFYIGNSGAISQIAKYYSTLSWFGTWNNNTFLTFTIADPDCVVGSSISVSITGWNALFANLTIRNVVTENGQFRVTVLNQAGNLTGGIPISFIAFY